MLAQEALGLLMNEVGDDLVIPTLDGKNDEIGELLGDPTENKASNELKVYNENTSRLV
jgi:hypothetical protein